MANTKVKIRKLIKQISIVMVVVSNFFSGNAQEATAPKLTFEEAVLKRKIDALKKEFDRYDKYQMTFIPDNWRMPVMQSLLALSDWELIILLPFAAEVSGFMTCGRRRAMKGWIFLYALMGLALLAALMHWINICRQNPPSPCSGRA